MQKYLLKALLLSFIISQTHANIWNNPHNSKKIRENILFTFFDLPPKKLDPVISYSSNEWRIIGNIYEPPLQYNYLKRPYTLEPLTLKQMPIVKYLNSNGREVDENSTDIAFTNYRLEFKEDIIYQNHPSFVKKSDGTLLYGALSENELKDIESLDDFEKLSTRKLTAEDYLYAIKRMAVRKNNSPILDTMQQYIVGLEEFSKKISKIAKNKKGILDLRPYSISGVKVIDDYTLDIKIKDQYPQFKYWLTMYFFAPIPWEADLFYQQDGLKKKNLTLNFFPVGTGAYYLAENNPNREMRLLANPNYHDEFYPTLTPKEMVKSNIPKELQADAGKKLPFIKEIIYSLEKESIPLWNKFLQGYYDSSGISSESFDQAVEVSSAGNMRLSDEMKKKNIVLQGSVQPSVFYLAFNMIDPIVGGYTKSAQKLRQAISIVQNEEEFISIFQNERGIPAQSLIPPGIFGYEEGEAGTNRVIYDYINGKRVRKSLEVAKKLLAEAGYPNGISIKTGKPLKLYYDITATGPDDRAKMDWRRKQFAKLGIQLVIRATDYNRFQDKVRKGKVQLFSWGWNADYPDPENFLFLLYSKNASIDTNGAGLNSANYKNPKFDKLFEEIKTMKNSPQRLKKIKEMLNIVREDAPWIWGIHPKSLGLSHSWFKNIFPNVMANNTLKYKRIDAELRAKKQEEWNQPVIMPLVLFILFPILMIYPLYRGYQGRQKAVIS